MMKLSEYSLKNYALMKEYCISIVVSMTLCLCCGCTSDRSKHVPDIYDFVQHRIGVNREQMRHYGMNLILWKRIDDIGLKYYIIEGSSCKSCVILEDVANNKFYFGYGDEIYQKVINIYQGGTGIDDKKVKAILGNPLRYEIAHPIEEFFNDRYKDIKLDFETCKIVFDSLFLDKGTSLYVDSIKLQDIYRNSVDKFKEEHKDRELTESYKRYLLMELLDARDLSSISYSYWYLANKHSLCVVNVYAILMTSKHPWGHDKDRYCYVVRVKKMILY